MKNTKINTKTCHEQENKTYKVYLKNITKTFLNGKIIANENITLKVKENEIHAIIGENGAGKSTLMSILFGLYEQDSGQIFINGEEIKFKSAKDAHKHKIGMVHQHFKLIDDYTVFQNIILGNENIIESNKNFVLKKISNFLGLVENKKTRKKIENLIETYNLNVDLNEKISNLSVGDQQKVEILKLLFLDSEILIFDEPTAVLSDLEIQSFLKMIQSFKDQGKTIILISHKLNELKKVADYGTVIRHGKLIGTFDVKNTTIEKMATLMVGKELSNIKNKSNTKFGPVNLRVDLPLSLLSNKSVKVPRSSWLSQFYAKIELSNQINKIKIFFYNLCKKIHLIKFFNLKKPKELDFTIPNVSFDVRAGEIFAIAGVQGNGQSELIEYVSGLKKAPTRSIMFNVNNELKDVSKYFINKNNKKISFVPEDRHKHGLILDDSISFNSVFNFLYSKKFTKLGFLNPKAIDNHALKIINEFDVRGANSLDENVRGLSGGNQQKLILGREIIKNSNIVLLSQPTRGLDIGAIEYIHKRILQAKEEQKAILLISYELDEILTLADTIAVMSKNQIVGVGSVKEMTRNKIGFLIANQGERNIKEKKNE